MGNFAFRLQKVFEYRELEEGWAKDNFLARHIARMEVENELFQLEDDRKLLLSAGADDLNARMDLEIRIQKLDDHERSLRILIQELTLEEEKARDEWILKRQDKSVLEKLRDKAYEAWMTRQGKLEQAALDEWAVQKQKAA
jgi:flagellar protein FliJ